MGVANIDSAARTCHAPSTVGLKQTIGVAASTCSMQDVLDTDLVVLWGTNVANNQPVFTKYLYLARKRGARVVVVNPYLEPGLERYWVPSNAESALFGTKLCDLHVPVRPEGDVALANAVLQRADRARRRRPRVGRRPHRGLGRARRPPRHARPRHAARAGRRRRRDVRALRRPLRRRPRRGARLEHGHHPAHPRRRRRPGDRQRRPRPRQRRARRRRADADPRPLRRAGRRRDGRLRDRVPRWRAGRRRARRDVVASDGASTCAADVGLTAPEMVEAAERGRARRAVRRRLEPARGDARPAARRGGARPACRCACTRTSCSRRRCSSTATT